MLKGGMEGLMKQAQEMQQDYQIWGFHILNLKEGTEGLFLTHRFQKVQTCDW